MAIFGEWFTPKKRGETEDKEKNLDELLDDIFERTNINQAEHLLNPFLTRLYHRQSVERVNELLLRKVGETASHKDLIDILVSLIGENSRNDQIKFLMTYEGLVDAIIKVTDISDYEEVLRLLKVKFKEKAAFGKGRLLDKAQLEEKLI